MKERPLTPLDRIMIEGKIDDYQQERVTLQELNEFMNWYEEKQFDTRKYRERVKEIVKKEAESGFCNLI